MSPAAGPNYPAAGPNHPAPGPLSGGRVLPTAPQLGSPAAAMPAKKDRTNLWILISLLAIGGISAAVWAATREKKADPWDHPADPTDKPDEPSDHPSDHPSGRPDEPHDNPSDPSPTPPPPPAKDPWSGGSPSVGTPSVGTVASTPSGQVPDGARLILPAGFTTTSGPGPAGQLITNNQTHMAIALTALPVGFDEDKFVVELAKQPGAHVDRQISVTSAGGLRSGVQLSSAINRVPVFQYVVFFPNRLLVMAVVPKSVAKHRGFDAAAKQFWQNNVVMP